MTNELQTTGANPWETYGKAAATRSNVGELMKFTKGDFVSGPYNDEVPIGAKFYAIMDSLNVGWTKWENNRPAEELMGAIGEGFQPKRRAELGDNDKSQWETDDAGQPRDPWQFSNKLILVAVETGRPYTFTTSSRGGLNAIGELCKAFGKNMRQQPDKVPVIELDVGSYQHSNRSFGRIKFPVFRIADWADAARAQRLLDGASDAEGNEDVGGDNAPAATKKASATPKKKSAEPPQF
jgi:hypothetical protein